MFIIFYLFHLFYNLTVENNLILVRVDVESNKLRGGNRAKTVLVLYLKKKIFVGAYIYLILITFIR